MISVVTRRPSLVAALAAILGVSALLVVGTAPIANASISWSAVNPPLPANAVTGQGVTIDSSSCPVDGWCIAVGDYPAVTGGVYYSAGLILSESGGTWSAMEAPLPTGASADPQGLLASVTCPTLGSCVAVGRYLDASGATQALVEQLANGVWTPSASPLPADALTYGTSAYAQLTALACPVAGSCAAVGVYTQSGGGEQAFVDGYAGGGWSAATAPLPAAASGSQFLGLSCPSAGACVATGTYLVAGTYLGMVDTLAGGAWSAVALPLPAGASSLTSIANNDLAVSCTAASSCVVAGTTFDGSYEGVVDTLSGGSWSASYAPTPGGAASPDVQLDAVACGDATDCVATGLVTVGGVAQGLIESLSSGAWSASYAPEPSGTASSTGIEVHDVACPTSTTCVAVGQSNAAGTVTGLFWNLSGGAWVVTTAPLPTDASASPDPSFAPVTCPAAGTCDVVGTYLNTTGAREGVVETDPSLLPSTTSVGVPTQSGSSMTYTAVVSGSSTPTGTVVFSAGLSALCAATIVSGNATCTGPVPSAGTVVGSYSGDGTFSASWGSAAIPSGPAQSPSTPTQILPTYGWIQSAKVNTWFAKPMQVKVTDSSGHGVPGILVIFTFPTNGPSAVIWGSSTAITNSLGLATSPVLSANSKHGSYSPVVYGWGVPASAAATFYFTNTKT